MSKSMGEDDWLGSHIFQCTYTILGKVYRFVINVRSCENIMSAKVVQKLNIQTEKHSKPYKLAWLKKGGEVSVSKRALLSFYIGLKYKDVVWCDVIAMDACHMLLGRPWQYDRSVYHDGRANTYSLMFEGVKIVLLPGKQALEQPKLASDVSALLSLAQFEEELQE